MIAQGSYLKSYSWQNVLAILRKRVNMSDIQLAAVDCIITVRNPANDREKKGAIVLVPQEIYRTAYNDVPPFWSYIKTYLDYLINDIRIGIRRIYHSFLYIIFLQNIKAYKVAVYQAIIKELGNWPKNVAYILVPSMPHGLLHGARIAARLIREYKYRKTVIKGVVTSKWAAKMIKYFSDPFDLKLLEKAIFVEPL